MMTDGTKIGAGAMGARLPGRLTAELVLRSPQYMNCVKDYHIDLRAHRISAIENLGTTENQFDSVDLSDNVILILDGFPKLSKLRVVLLNNNRITRIARNLEEYVPNLTTLVLTNNRLKNLQDLTPLSTLPKLTHLSLLQNEVALKPNYRLFVVHKLKHLKVLDCRRVTPKEREEAERKFGEGAQDAEKTFEPGEGLPEVEAASAPEEMAEEPPVQPTTAKAKLTPEQATAIRAAIENAKTFDEVNALEKALTTGHMPSQLKDTTANGGATAMEEG